ncbi:MAG TPA: hypothetical protein VH640_17660 [Bryobacteraceae bacterium]
MTRPIILDVGLRSEAFGPRLPRPRACPLCGSNNIVPIVYGLLTEEGVEEARAGKFVCGGCMLDLDGPQWYCKTCKHRWPKNGSLCTDEENLAYRLRSERYRRHPHVFLVISARKLRWFVVGLIEKFSEECVWIPLLIRREKPFIEKRIALKEGGYRYMVRFQNEVVRVAPKHHDRDQLDAHCTSKENYLAGTAESRRYKTVAMRLVFKEAPHYKEAMEAGERESREEIKRGVRRRRA